MKIDIKELLDFFDDKKDSHNGDANSIIAVLGEDLNASVYKHYRKNKVDILDDSVLPGTSKGKRLDRWIVDNENKKLFQCEIKSWAASAIGGKQLKTIASVEDINKVVIYYWNRELNNNLSKDSKDLHPNHVTKVLLKMKIPKGCKYAKIEPLIIYWMPISSDINGINPLSVISVKSLKLPIDSPFQKLNIFSVSLYLRQLYKNGKGKKFIDLDMPHFEHRIKIINNIQNKK